MKGGNVIILQALRALYQHGELKDMNISVVMTGDEELSGRPLSLARKVLREEASNADYVLGFENGDGDPKTALISRRGSSSWELEVTGKPSHSSQIFSEQIGAGAIYEISRILDSFYDELAGEQYLTFNPGLILGGTLLEHNKDLKSGKVSGKNNVVAQKAVATGDIRTISPEQYEKTISVMQEIVSRHLPETQATLVFDEGYPPLPPSEGNKMLLSYLSKVSEDMGYGEIVAVDPMKAGAADVSFASGLAPMIIDGLGLGGANDHTVNETADLNTMVRQTKNAVVLIWRLGQMK
jgi:glutamate carboxypeptidase